MEGANELVRQLRNLAVEAADALWALHHHKEPKRHPIAINQEIHLLRTKIDALFPPTTKKRGFLNKTPRPVFFFFFVNVFFNFFFMCFFIAPKGGDPYLKREEKK